MPTTLRDVAEAAGVSITSVSKVLHGRGKSVRVSDETARAIREAARRLQYTPNELARTLRTGKTRTIGLLFENFGSIGAGPLYYVELLDGVAKALFRHHYRLTIIPEVGDDDAVCSLADGRLDGVIWCKMPHEERHWEFAERCPIPVVAMNTPPPDSPHDMVYFSCDNQGGAALVVNHLAELGHRRIAFALEKGEEKTPDAQARLAGFLATCRSIGLPTSLDDVFVWSPDAREMPRWYANTDYTAVFAWNEMVAAEVLRQAARCGVRVPQDLSVVGFDSTRFCDTTSPRLTAVRQPITQMAEAAAGMLLRMVGNRQPEKLAHVFPCTFDVRDSTGAPNTGRAKTPPS